jgi:hypothetical protein
VLACPRYDEAHHRPNGVLACPRCDEAQQRPDGVLACPRRDEVRHRPDGVLACQRDAMKRIRGPEACRLVREIRRSEAEAQRRAGVSEGCHEAKKRP